LMACDILLYDPEVVPVGADQKQHVEYARDTAQKFNGIFGETFSLPKDLILKEIASVPGTDGQKMSKSYNNTIPLFGTDEEIKKAVMSIVTDSKTPEEPKDPDTCTIFALHKLFVTGQKLEDLRSRYADGGLGYKEAKEMLFEEIIALVRPMRERREMYARDIDAVIEILHKGNARAREVANKKMSLVRANIGVDL